MISDSALRYTCRRLSQTLGKRCAAVTPVPATRTPAPPDGVAD